MEYSVKLDPWHGITQNCAVFGKRSKMDQVLSPWVITSLAQILEFLVFI